MKKATDKATFLEADYNRQSVLDGFLPDTVSENSVDADYVLSHEEVV
jgi:hypothetical protein